LVECGVDLEKAKKLFYDKFYDKTRNDWIDRRDFCKVSGKYDLIEMDYGVNENNTVSMIETSNDDVIKAISSLDEAVQHLIKLICDVRSMEETLIEMEYDTAKAPLGRLTKAQVTAGYEALRTIESFIEKSSFSKGFIEAINEYYTRIPHSFGMRQPPLIKTKEELKRELDLLEVLQEIEVAIRTMKAEHDEPGLHQLDRHYRSLNCNLIWMAPDSDNYQLIERYLQMTHAPTHNTYKMRLKNLFEVEKDGESEQFQSELGNRHLLWHGSRLTNWFGILSRGLHIAPPEAPVTGYMFGKGLYFADLSSKSANYCFPQRGRPGLLILAEVALGDWHYLTAADSDAARLPANKHSTRGLGRYGPDPNGLCTLSNGCIVPCGKPIALNGRSKCSLNYNEYVVYSRSQVMLRYLVEVDFEFC